MSSIYPYGTAYKAKVVSRLPFLKNVIIESVEKKKWHWLLKVLTSSIECYDIKVIMKSGDDRYFYENNDNDNEITKEEADAMIKETNDKYSNILQAAWDYNIPVYVEQPDYYNPEIKEKSQIQIIKQDGVVSIEP